MDRTLGTPAAPRIKGVSQQILDSHLIYGSSDNMQPRYMSANRSLNYASGGSITSPDQDRVSIIPFNINYKDTVGLFGKENHFIKINVKIDPNVALACFEEEGWKCAIFSAEEGTDEAGYTSGTLTPNDIDLVNSYYRANVIEDQLKTGYKNLLSVDLHNFKTGNKYVDVWLDVRLYTRNREEHPYDKLYVAMNDYFYIGFHARNTRRLPYNVQLQVGQEFFSEGVPDSELRYVNR